MGDLISRKKLRDSLEPQFEKVIHRVTDGSQYYTGFWNGLVEAKKAIDSAPVVETELKWIPVTERLPEYGENVLAYLENKITVLRRYNGFFEKTLGVRHGKLVSLDVTHWMSLPESPKEER